MSTRTCWAEPLGACEGGLSGEHIVSACLFDAKMLMVQGFPWCAAEPKEVSVASLTKNILCKRHNSQLSPLDEEALNYFNAQRRCVELNEARGRAERQIWNFRRFDIDGWRLERWFLKTLINIWYGSSQPIRDRDGSAGRPPIDVIACALGSHKLQEGAGLYLLARAGETQISEDRVRITPMTWNNAHIAAEFLIRGSRFLMTLLPEKLEEFRGSAALYRESKMIHTMPDRKGKSRPSHGIFFNFKE